MKADDFEQTLARQPLRPPPAEWREAILRAARAAAPAENRAEWRDTLALLFWPSPKAWGALAAAWLVIIGANLAMNSGVPAPAPARTAGANWREQQRLMAELLGGGETQSIPSAPKPSPRSEGPGNNSWGIGLLSGITGDELLCLRSGLGCSSALFPLTPAISLGEREPRSPALEVIESPGFTGRCQQFFPLPKGEGLRVRGKGAIEYAGVPFTGKGFTACFCSPIFGNNAQNPISKSALSISNPIYG